MQAYSQPLSKLHVEVSRFTRDRSLRLLHVITDASLHDATVEILAAQEYRADNRSPFVILQEPHKRNDPGWDRRALTVRRQHEQRRTQMAEHGEALGELPAAPASKGLVGLGEQLGQLLLVRPEGTEGLVVLLAPSYVEAPERWQHAIGVLLSTKALAGVRFMIVDRERSSLGGLVAQHERHTRSVTCRVEGESPKAVLAGALDEEILSFDGPVGARPRGVIPPRRINDPPARPPDPEAVRQLAVSRNVLLASVAVEEGRMRDAIDHQRSARDDSMAAGRIEQAVMMELVLGGYLVTAGAVAQAEETYARAAALAEAAALRDKAAMARLALGSSRLVHNDRTGALVEFAQASTLAEQGGHDALALHACRLTGDVARELRMDAQAIAFWAKAIEIAERDPPTAPLTSAGLVALQLAVICRERGQHAAADAFLNKADALVRLEPEQLRRATEESVDTAPAVDESPMVIEASARTMRPNDASGPGEANIVDPAPADPVHEDVPPRAALLPNEGATQFAQVDVAASHQTGLPPDDQPTETERFHRWSSVEQSTLRSTTTEIIGQETTALLSQTELAALRGEVDLPPARVTSDEQTERIAIARELSVPPGDGTELYTQDMIHALRAAWAERNAGDSSTPDGKER